MVLEAIRYKRGSLAILNQLKLPHEQEYNEIHNSEEAWHAIKEMRTRGAPAIAIVAALSIAVEICSPTTHLSSLDNQRNFIHKHLDYLETSRPTAVNLADAVRKLKAVTQKAYEEGSGDGQAVTKVYIETAEQMLLNDVSDNEAIGRHGAKYIMLHSPKNGNEPVSVLTHCNTGSLATAGYGTALGVIRSLHADGSLKHAYCTETRPYNQGSRLTAFELVHDRIPSTLITDSMAAALFRLKKDSENIAAVVVGADRVAANGDTANKIGTYQLAVLAKYHGVKFLVAAPRATIDLHTPSGKEIVIEERPGKEVATVTGPVYDGSNVDTTNVVTIKTAANGIEVWNPAFDVTPAELIDGIITEVGVVEKGQDGKYDLEPLFEMKGNKVPGYQPSSIGGV